MILTNRTAIKKQDGIVLLILVVVLALTISTYYFSGISLVEIQADKLQKTRTALAQAKQLLLSHAMIRTDISVPSSQLGRYGYLPCPANNNVEGSSDDPCESKNENTLGWFPWRSLKTEALKDGNGDCLLYAVSGAYKSSPRTDMLNEDSNGIFQIVNETNVIIQGVTPPDRIVAIVFSAGGALPGQTRVYTANTKCGKDIDNFSAYLDSFEVSAGVFVDNSALVTGNDDEVYKIVQASIAINKGIFNDQLITITRDELWSAISARNDFIQKMSNLTEALALCLSDYAAANANNRLPWPVPMDLSDYREEDDYDDNADAGPGYAGRFPFIVDDSNNEIGIVGADNELFKEAGCDVLALPTGGITADLLGAVDDEYENLWKNWKDHLFYVVSADYAPSANVAVACTSPTPPIPPNGDCITVNGTKRAAAVIFSGSRDEAQLQVRTGPVGTDANTKHLINNYLENGNEGVFPDNSGTGAYITGGNDIMFCIADGLGVVPC